MTTRTILLTLLATCLMLWSCDTKTKKEGCGNGLLDLGEACDGGELQGATCESLGHYNVTGTLTCGAQCQYDLSDCGGRCGDNVMDAEEGETCDGGNLNGQTCQSLGYSGGALACGADCAFDMSGCTSTCGNGIMEGGETCDDGNAFGMDGCSSTCVVETGWECDEDSPSVCTTVCGDDLVVGDEVCDGTDLGGATCESLGYYGGTLLCGDDCGFDVTGCETEGRCGNGTVQVGYGEECDGTELSGASCGDFGFYQGTLSCSSDCRLVTSGCSQSCGDADIQTVFGEACDGTNLDAQTCLTLGYGQASGALVCTGTCSFNETACVPKSENADLATLTVSEGTLTPAFDPATLVFNVSVDNAITTVTVAATAADSQFATVELSLSQPMTLLEGVNPVTVTVTAENGTQKVITINVHRWGENYTSAYIGVHIPAHRGHRFRSIVDSKTEHRGQ